MNIFVLDNNPIIAAQYHCDKHVVKMILESAQMLSTAHHVLDKSSESMLYRPTHVNHPCSVWVRKSSSNYLWAFTLFKYLCFEYTYRYGKIHKTPRKLGRILCCTPSNIPRGSATPFPLAMPDQYKDSDPVIAYRNYYANDKAKMLVYTRRRKPEWIKNHNIHSEPTL